MNALAGMIKDEKVKIHDQRTVINQLQKRTGIEVIRYDCCKGSCMLFVGPSADLEFCHECKKPQYKYLSNNQKVPIKTFDYIPLIHRLRLQVADPQRSQKMREYCESINDPNKYKDIMTDIWHGELMKHLKEKKKLFTQVSDIALGLTGDGVPLFKSFNWGKMACFPLMLTNFNLPPEERNKAENILLLGVIPGLSEPKLMNTFLYPLVQELLLLEAGIDNVWDGYIKQDI